MKYSKLFGKTKRDFPKDAKIRSHQLLVKAGFISKLSAGIYSFLPLGYKAIEKIDRIIKQELSKADMQHLHFPIFHPVTIWKKTGRYEAYKGQAAFFKSRNKKEFIVAPTNEEVATLLVKQYVKSAKDLPVILNQNQWKYRDELRAYGGLLRTREFLMQDAYSFDKDLKGLDVSFKKASLAYHSIFKQVGLDTTVVQADSGTMGGTGSEEFMVPAEAGEDMVFACNKCDYKANIEKCVSEFETHPQDKEMKARKNVLGKGIIGVDELAEFLNIPVYITTKTMIYQADDKVVAVMIRGDYNISETKLQNYLGCINLELASKETVKKVTGAEIGYAGPIGLPKPIRLIADLSTKDRVNFEAGANKTNYHSLNVNFERDFPTPEFVDIRESKVGDKCSMCKDGKLKKKKCIELGHVFKLGTSYSEKLQAFYKDSDGKDKPIYMGCYGIGLGRLLSAIAETSNDKKGIIWPASIAPYQIHLISLEDDKNIKSNAEDLYNLLEKEGVEVLWDERDDVSAGVKFNDADLIGIPIRIVVSKRSLGTGGAELKLRREEKSEIVKMDKVIDTVKKKIKTLEEELNIK